METTKEAATTKRIIDRRQFIKALAQVRRFGAVFDFFQKNTLDTNLSGAIWGILFT
jgi:hypothetical protein